MKKISFISLIGIALMIFGVATVFAGPVTTEPDAGLAEQLEAIDLESIDKIAGKSLNPPGRTLRSIVEDVIAGNLDLSMSGIINGALEIFFQELYVNTVLIRNLLIIAILSALLKNLTESFRNKSVGELGFYVSYMALVMVLLAYFNSASAIIRELVGTLTEMMISSVPLFMSMLVISGSVAGAYALNPIIIFSANLVAMMINNLILPLIVLAAVMQIVNYLTEKETLANFSGLISKGCALSMTGITILFVGILSIQKISAPILNNMAVKAAKATAGAVPVVGGVLGGAIDMVMYWSSVAKSGVAVAMIILVITVCAAPLIKLFTLIAVYKITAAVIEPVCDQRIVKCIDSIASMSLLIMAAGAMVVVMFIFSVIIMLSL